MIFWEIRLPCLAVYLSLIKKYIERACFKSRCFFFRLQSSKQEYCWPAAVPSSAPERTARQRTCTPQGTAVPWPTTSMFHYGSPSPSLYSHAVTKVFRYWLFTTVPYKGTVGFIVGKTGLGPLLFNRISVFAYKSSFYQCCPFHLTQTVNITMLYR